MKDFPTMFRSWAGGGSLALLVAVVASMMVGGCATLPSSGPSAGGVRHTTKAGLDSSIRIVDVDQMAATRLAHAEPPQSLAAYFGDPIDTRSVVGRGDVLDISIWEAPPAALFGTSTSEARLTSSTPPITTARPAMLPEMMVDQEGRINVPFAGSLLVAGRTPTQIASDIKGRLAGKANQPQVLVRVVRNASANATVVGDVVNSGTVPLTAKGERLLDALAFAGGVRQPVGKMTIQIARGDRIAVESLTQIIRDPRENIRLKPGDVVTALFQPFSFTVLGATKKNEEIPFEATGFTLAQALGRVGGLDDMRADPRGVFIFRLENPNALGLPPGTPVQLTADGKVPVIYRIDMKNPETFFVAQSFPVRDKDVLYVSNAPIAEFQKFVTAISGTVLPFATVAAVIP